MNPELFYGLWSLWTLSGSISFIYWWTKHYDLKVSSMILVILSGFIGPLAFLVGYLVHGDRPRWENTVLMKRRKGD